MYADQRLDRNMPAPKCVSRKLIIGQEYIVKAQVYGMNKKSDNPWADRGASEAPTKMTLVGLYPNFARFQRKAGYFESFRYWELARKLIG